MIDIEWQETARRLILRERQGSYPGMPATRQFLVILPGEQAAGDGRLVTYTGSETEIGVFKRVMLWPVFACTPIRADRASIRLYDIDI